MKTMAVIPARRGSTRLPDKPLLDLGGWPVVYWTYRRTCLAHSVDQVILATDDEEIARLARDFGATVALTSPDCPNGTVRAYEATKALDVDWVINVQGDEPFVHPAHIDAVATLLKESACPMATLVAPATEEQKQDPNCVKVALNLKSEALYFSRSPLPYERHPAAVVWRHLGLYGYRADFLDRYVAFGPTPLSEAESLEQLRVLEQGYSIACARLDAPLNAPGIDTLQDLELARALVQEKGLKPDVVA